MTDHYDYTAMLSALVDGELDEDERAEVLAHLETCESCREELAQLQRLHDVLADTNEYEPPAGFAAGVMARLHEDELAALRARKAAAPRRASPRRWYAVAACAAAVVLMVSVLPRTLRMGSSQKAAVTSTAPAAASTGTAEAPTAMPFAPADDGAQAEVDNKNGDTLFEASASLSSVPTEAASVTAAEPASDAADRRACVLLGDGAADWLAANAALDADMGAYPFPAAQLRELPEGLSLSPEDEAALDALADDETVYLVAAPSAPAEAQP